MSIPSDTPSWADTPARAGTQAQLKNSGQIGPDFEEHSNSNFDSPALIINSLNDFDNPEAYMKVISEMTSAKSTSESFLPKANFTSDFEATASGDGLAEKADRQTAFGPSAKEAKELAERTFNAMNTHYGNYPHNTWAYLAPGYTSAWPLSQQIQAVLLADKMGDSNLNIAHELNQRLDGLHYYWQNRNGIGGYGAGVDGIFNNHERFYDDNAWIGLNLLDTYERDRSQGWALEQAKKVFDFEKHGEQEAKKVSAEPGGVMWEEGDKKGYRATVSTAGASQLALRLYEQTGSKEKEYLDFAKRHFDWVENHLSDGRGLYIDGIEGNGNKHHEVYSYNQGLMLGDAIMLYKATGDQSYKEKAELIMNAAGKHFTEEELEKQQPIFNAIYFKNLIEADEILNSPPDLKKAHTEMIRQYAEHLRRHMGRNGVIITGLEEDTSWKSTTQSAAVQIFSMLAKLSS